MPTVVPTRSALTQGASFKRGARKGATSIEYALIAVLVSTALIAGLQAYIGSAHDLYTFIAEVITNSF